MLSYTLAAIVLATAGATAEEPSDPVKAAYHDYVVAQDKHDLPAAEAAAAKALAASEARDGAGGSTAVLAFNLAMVRLDLKHHADAVGPARRAADLAKAGAKGVEPLRAELILAEAELTTDPKADEHRAEKALEAAKGDANVDDFAYPAAIALAKAAGARKNWSAAAQAWLSAAAHAHGAHSDDNLVRGRALTQAAIIETNRHELSKAKTLMAEALPLLSPYAPEAKEFDRVTVGDFFLADAVALEAAVAALEPSGDFRRELRGRYSRATAPGLARVCSGRMAPRPYPAYPERPLRESEIGAVVMRFRIGPSGEVLAGKALSTVINDDFRKAVEDPKVHWVWTPDTQRDPGCRVATEDLWVPIMFRIG